MSSSLELQVGQKREWCSDESEDAAEICSSGSVGPVGTVDTVDTVDTSGESVVCIRRW